MGVHLQITDPATHKVIARTWNTSERACWFTVEPVIAEWFCCHVDAVGLDDDFVTVNGQQVAEIITSWDRTPNRDIERRAA